MEGLVVGVGNVVVSNRESVVVEDVAPGLPS